MSEMPDWWTRYFLPKFKVNTETGCWEWTASRNPRGYSCFQIHRRAINGHKAAFLAVKGEVPPGMVLDHLCRQRHCVNPDHLEPVTPRENILRGLTVTKATARMRCSRGHALTPDNVYLNPRKPNQKVCLACRRMYDTTRREKNRARRAGELVSA